MHEQANRVARYYDEDTEPFYLRTWDADHLHFGLFEAGELDRGRALSAMTRSVVSPGAITAADLVVDAGCGVGGAALQLARDVGCQVVGLNVSEVQLRIARQRAERGGLGSRVRFERADCSVVLPFESESIDVVMSIEAACHFADKRAFLRECKRILRPGGRLVASDWMKRSGPLSQPDERMIAEVEDAWNLAGLESLSGWRELLNDAGLAVMASAEYGDDVMENARLLRRAYMDLMLEQANGCHTRDQVNRWSHQYVSLIGAWFGGQFSLGRFVARSEPHE